MMEHLRIAVAQLNPCMGDIAGNLAKARVARAAAESAGADLLLFTELFIIGYPPEDLVLKQAFQADARAAIEELAKDTVTGPAVLIGTPWVVDGALYNAVAVLDGGHVVAVSRKYDLPNYGVFDEKRVFSAGPLPEPVTVRGVRLGLPICEDIWTPAAMQHLASAGAELMLVPNGSPFETGKEDVRLQLVRQRVGECGVPLVYLNQVGGQDEVVFDGASLIVNADGSVPVSLPAWEEKFALTDWTYTDEGW
ncbi:MAG: nitrilase-related carbon-nitrogen hydrolase, partial [Rhizomicrobium sp.]